MTDIPKTRLRALADRHWEAARSAVDEKQRAKHAAKSGDLVSYAILAEADLADLQRAHADELATAYLVSNDRAAETKDLKEQRDFARREKDDLRTRLAEMRDIGRSAVDALEAAARHLTKSGVRQWCVNTVGLLKAGVAKVPLVPPPDHVAGSPKTPKKTYLAGCECEATLSPGDGAPEGARGASCRGATLEGSPYCSRHTVATMVLAEEERDNALALLDAKACEVENKREELEETYRVLAYLREGLVEITNTGDLSEATPVESVLKGIARRRLTDLDLGAGWAVSKKA